MAHHDQEDGFLEGAVSHAYYAMFHAAKAFLELNDKSPRTHKGVILQLGQYVKLGKLSKDEVRSITHGLNPDIEKVVLYGSRAKDNYREGSDIDLTLMGDALSHAQLNRIKMQIDDLLLPYTIDLSIFELIDNANLIDHIRRVGVVFYERDIM